MVSTYNGKLFSNVRKWDANTFLNVDMLRKHYSKWMKPDTKRLHIVLFHLFQIHRMGKSVEKEDKLVVA